MAKNEPGGDILKSLALSIGAGVLLFLAVMASVNLVMIRAGLGSDPTIVDFYLLMGGAGALFGFERWWAQQNGPYNPFHE